MHSLLACDIASKCRTYWVGWGGVKTFVSTSTTWYVHFHTNVMLRCWMFFCTSTHTSTSCYAAGRSLALPHIRLRHATLLDILLHFHTYVMLRCWTFCHCCTSTHMSTSCYAAGRSFARPHIRHAKLLDFLLHFHTYVTLPCWTFPSTRTLLDVLLHFRTYVMQRCWTFSCTSTHTSTSCYAAGRSLAFPQQTGTTLCLKQKKCFF